MNTAVLQVAPSEKKCSKCEAVKSVSDFYRHEFHGITSQCKECIKEYNRNNRAKHNLNPELAKARRKKHYDKMMKDAKKHSKHLANKNKWNKSPKYYDGYYKKRFGLSLEQVLEIFSRQNGLCANVGCSKEISIMQMDDNKAVAAIDHNHKTGKVRSLLCVRCNTLLGHVENNKSLIPGLMEYLNKHK